MLAKPLLENAAMPVATSIVTNVVSFAWSRAVSLRVGALVFCLNPRTRAAVAIGSLPQTNSFGDITMSDGFGEGPTLLR
jgi:hypothetical protein